MMINKMNLTFAVTLVTVAFICGCVAPPVTKNKQEQQGDEVSPQDRLEDSMEYSRYLREVVTALESDPEFRKKLEKADEADIRSGKIANELEFVSHQIRNRLDEIKRTELIRLRELTRRKQELVENNSIDDPAHHHLDHTNEHTFEIEDLRKLIFKTTQDLAEADRKRREEFKEYELQKEYEKMAKLNHTAGEEKEKLERQYKEMEEKHKNHEKLHEPGHKQQLEEVWEEQDHMQQDFDPKTFFMLHDLDSNGLWDETEVKALFIKELDKMYAAGAPEDDMRERAEEMERMRESVFAEVDANKDGFIDYKEFIAQTKRNDFQQDHGWKGLDEQQPPYTDEELQEYIRIHELHPFFGDISRYVEATRAHHNQMPPPGVGYQGHLPPGGYQVPPGGYHPNEVYDHPPVPSQNQLNPGQLPQVQINPQQMYHQKIPLQGNPQMQGGAPSQGGYLNPAQQTQQGNQANVQYNQQNVPGLQPNSQKNQPNLQQNQQLQNKPNVQQQDQFNLQQQNQPNYQQNVQVDPQRKQLLSPHNPQQNSNIPPPVNDQNINMKQNEGVPQVQKV